MTLTDTGTLPTRVLVTYQTSLHEESAESEGARSSVCSHAKLLPTSRHQGWCKARQERLERKLNNNDKATHIDGKEAAQEKTSTLGYLKQTKEDNKTNNNEQQQSRVSYSVTARTCSSSTTKEARSSTDAMLAQPMALAANLEPFFLYKQN